MAQCLLLNDQNEKKVVVKKLLGQDPQEQKAFIKEARMLHETNHTYIVKFQGISTSPFGLVLEYVYFDFKPFGDETRVSNLDDFLILTRGALLDW